MKKLLTCIAMGFATTSYAVPPLWMRDVQISPDGTEIAFLLHRRNRRLR